MRLSESKPAFSADTERRTTRMRETPWTVALSARFRISGSLSQGNNSNLTVPQESACCGAEMEDNR